MKPFKISDYAAQLKPHTDYLAEIMSDESAATLKEDRRAKLQAAAKALVEMLADGEVSGDTDPTLEAEEKRLKGGSQEQKERLLPQVAAGTAKLALAVAESNGATDGPGREAVARKQSGAGYLITGVRSFVIDAAAADWLVVAAAEEGAAHRAFFLVDARQAAVQADPLPWRDVTRQVCDVRFRNAVAEPLAADDAALWPWLRDRVLFALATESGDGLLIAPPTGGQQVGPEFRITVPADTK